MYMKETRRQHKTRIIGINSTCTVYKEIYYNYNKQDLKGISCTLYFYNTVPYNIL